jgi:hypothetical protein
MSEVRSYRFMVFSNPVQGREQEYEEWYDNQHFRDLLAIPGFVAVQRFRLTEAQARPGEHPHQYLVVWEIETDDLAAVFEMIHERRADGRIVQSGAYDRTTSATHTWEPVTERVLAEGRS